MRLVRFRITTTAVFLLLAAATTAEMSVGAAASLVVSLSSSSPLRRNARWVAGGIGAELFHNALVRPLLSLGGRRQKKQPPQEEVVAATTRTTPTPTPTRELAIVTGATGGIGVEICRGLIQRNYDVVLLARNRSKGRSLAESLTVRLDNSSNNANNTPPPRATLVEYHADDAQSSIVSNIREAIGNRPVAILVNNAGVMGKTITKAHTLRVNLLAPALLTCAVIPSFRLQQQQQEHQQSRWDPRRPPLVVNVGSSSHLRAGKVQQHCLGGGDDSNLEAYAESKLGLMQFSTVLRSALPWLHVVDVHPGLVWTPMLQRNFPGAAFFEKIGLSKIFYKTPEEGAATILAAVDCCAAGKRSSLSTEQQQQQTYFVNRKPGGYASPESRNQRLSNDLWNRVLGPTIREVVPDGYKVIHNGLVGANKQQQQQ